MYTKDTIVALATPPGEGGVAIVRLSGPESCRIALNFFKPTAKVDKIDSHRCYHGHLFDSDGKAVDEILLLYMAAPRSYTTEDVVEFHCHGSQAVVRKVINLCYSSGARLAGPGEFTLRAFLNGRIDLSQAEAVSRLINSNSEHSRRLALAQLDGALSREMHRYSSIVQEALIYIEAWIDFPDEDLPSENLTQICQQLESVNKSIDHLTATYQTGRILSEGASIVIAGQPNVGKSSLLNALLGEERAIVTDIPGTTRDVIEEGFYLHGIPLRFVDTAGIRHTDDLVESEGIRRAEEKIKAADLVVVLFDGSRKIDDLDERVYQLSSSAPHLLVMTKSDRDPGDIYKHLSSIYHSEDILTVSSKTSQGLDELKGAIYNNLVTTSSERESVLLSEQRHFEALVAAKRSLLRFFSLVEADQTLDLFALELRDVLYHLGLITGETTTEDLLDGIFSGFCIGK